VIWLHVERQLEEAARRGAFDRLPGAGGPLDLTENPYVPPEWRPAFKILKDHRVLPEFLERRKEIEQIRAEMARARASAAGPHVYRAIVDRLAAAVEALNRSLARENHFVRGSLQLPPVDVTAEVAAYLGSSQKELPNR
jgi:hypothetical protein